MRDERCDNQAAEHDTGGRKVSVSYFGHCRGLDEDGDGEVMIRNKISGCWAGTEEM